MAKPEENNQTGIIEIDVETAINNQLAAQAINEEQAAYYINNGLTVVSNNTDIIPRDAAGNVIVQDGSYIVIETNSFNIDNISMLKVLDTQFNYFKFPVSVNREFVDPNFDFNFDNISAELRLPLPTDEKGQVISTQRISTLKSNGWFYNASQTTSGFKELPFIGGTQPRPNAYTVTQPVYDSLIEQNKTLQFKIQLQWTANDENDNGTYFLARITRENNKEYRSDDLRRTIFVNNGNLNSYPFLRVTIILDQDTIRPGDSYAIETVSGAFEKDGIGRGYGLFKECSWDITPVDPPVGRPLFRNIYSINDGNFNPADNTAVFKRIQQVVNDNTQTIKNIANSEIGPSINGGVFGGELKTIVSDTNIQNTNSKLTNKDTFNDD